MKNGKSAVCNDLCMHVCGHMLQVSKPTCLFPCLKYSMHFIFTAIKLKLSGELAN